MGQNGTKQRRIMAKPQAIQKARMEKGYTAKEFARRIGISRAGLSLIETRRGGTRESTAIEIVSLLGCEFDDLFEIVEPDNGTSHVDSNLQLALGVAEEEKQYANGNPTR